MHYELQLAFFEQGTHYSWENAHKDDKNKLSLSTLHCNKSKKKSHRRNIIIDKFVKDSKHIGSCFLVNSNDNLNFFFGIYASTPVPL